MLRYVLYHGEQQEVLLRKELEYITNFIELFKLKSSKQFNISFIESIKNESTLVAPMLFMPFIKMPLNIVASKKVGVISSLFH